MEGLTVGFVKARSSSFYYEEQGEGQPILLIPPSGSTASTWGALPRDLAGAGRVIAYDRRGYTRSGGEVVRSAAEHTRDAAAILDALEAGPTVLVGTSAGATIALDLAVRRPDLVRAVVVHEAAWRALRHPDASGLVVLAKMQWLAWRDRYPEAAETLLRWVYAYRDGGSAWDAFPEQWRQTARENGRSVVADLKGTMGGCPSAQDLATIDVHGAGGMEIRGDLLSHEFTIDRDGHAVAIISKRWLTATASYAVDIAAGEDDLLILASVLALDLAIDAEHDH
jgi:pimeloyl-ACP methyl ester carboxylesterase